MTDDYTHTDADAPPDLAPPLPDGLMVSSRGRVARSVHNAIILAREARSDIRLNSWTGRTECSDGEWTDVHSLRLTAHLEAVYGWQGSSAIIDQAVAVVAAERAYDPVREWLESLQWDMRPRLDGWLAANAGADLSPFVTAAFRKWLISAVARAFDPGCKADCVLILHGKQGAYKSTFGRVLAGEDHFCDQLPPMAYGRDFEEALQGVWIAELSELDHLDQASIATAKAVISRQTGHVRLPYARRSTELKRRCIFLGTSNEDEFLRDATGDRRWWPVKVGQIDVTALQRDRTQLFAEAVYAYRQGEKWYLDDAAVAAEAEAAQASRFRRDPWEEVVQRYCMGREWVTTHEVLVDCLRLEVGRLEQLHQNRVSRVLKRLGGRRAQVRVGGGRQWVYLSPDRGWSTPEDVPRAFDGVVTGDTTGDTSNGIPAAGFTTVTTVTSTPCEGIFIEEREKNIIYKGGVVQLVTTGDGPVAEEEDLLDWLDGQNPRPSPILSGPGGREEEE